MSGPATILFRGCDVFDGRRMLGRRDVLVRAGRIESIAGAGGIDAAAGSRIVDGGAVLPGLVDAHIHVSLSDPAAIVRGGVTAALDLGEPLDAAFLPRPPLRLRASGPLLTAPGGYPTQSWGANGYGFEIANARAARDAVAMLAGRGAAIIKVALAGDPALDASAVDAIVTTAHRHALRVAAHALRVADVRVAVAGGIDALAHTPVDALPDDLIASLAKRGTTIVSTVRAFGDARATRDNLAALAAAGCPVVYGTDLGNDGIEPGADAAELTIVAGALGGAEAALRAATSSAAEFAGFPPARIAPNVVANLIATRDLTFESIATPHLILIDGREFT